MSTPAASDDKRSEASGTGLQWPEVRLARQCCAGLFRSSKRYYVWKTSSTFSILVAALAVLVRWHESMWGLVGSAFLLGLFWQQGGWLAHDYLHHQVGLLWQGVDDMHKEECSVS